MFPDNLRPMPLERHHEPFSHRDWHFELKHVGFKALALSQSQQMLQSSKPASVAVLLWKAVKSSQERRPLLLLRTPLNVQCSDFFPIVLEVEVFGDEIREHEQ